jgi:putative spermidine/putrescine transport system substrate-binding protein
VVEYVPNSAKISEMVQTGEAGLFPLTPTAVSDLQDKGIPVGYVSPKEGPVLLLVDLCVVNNNPDPQLAQKLAQFLLSAPAQTKAAEAGKQIPTNRLAKMTPPMQQSLGNVDDLVKKVTVVDWDTINALRAQWDTRWNRQIER